LNATGRKGADLFLGKTNKSGCVEDARIETSYRGCPGAKHHKGDDDYRG